MGRTMGPPHDVSTKIIAKTLVAINVYYADTYSNCKHGRLIYCPYAKTTVVICFAPPERRNAPLGHGFRSSAGTHPRRTIRGASWIHRLWPLESPLITEVLGIPLN